MSDILVVNEIYLSLQGESTFAGLPCVFVRLTACDLRCSYCDTAYAFKEGKKMLLREVIHQIEQSARPYAKTLAPRSAGNSKDPVGAGIGRLPLVELTGGEPLLQKN